MPRSARLASLILLPVLALAACGKSEDVDTAAYTCADFNKSLRTKDDDSAGRFINELRKQAKLGQSKKTEQREITLGIYYTCRNSKGSVKPASAAIAAARKMKAGTFEPPGVAPAKKKKSTK